MLNPPVETSAFFFFLGLWDLSFLQGKDVPTMTVFYSWNLSWMKICSSIFKPKVLERSKRDWPERPRRSGNWHFNSRTLTTWIIFPGESGRTLWWVATGFCRAPGTTTRRCFALPAAAGTTQIPSWPERKDISAQALGSWSFCGMWSSTKRIPPSILKPPLRCDANLGGAKTLTAIRAAGGSTKCSEKGSGRSCEGDPLGCCLCLRFLVLKSQLTQLI